MSKFIDSLIATGIGGWKVVSSDGKEKSLMAVQSSSFFASVVENETVYTEIKIYKNEKDTFVFTRTFFIGYNELKLYKTSLSSLSEAKEVPLETIEETR